LSEKGDIAYLPEIALDESCYREVQNTDIFVLIIGGRYGAEKSESREELPKSFFDRYDSITKGEYQSAIEKDVPIYVLIEKSVYSDFETFLRNKPNKTVKYAHVDSVNIFRLIEDILARPRNNPVQQFDKYADIEEWLKEQWAGLFREMLTRSSGQRQIASLASQVGQLAEINTTLKNYLEEVVSKLAPKEAARLIATESKRLTAAQQLVGITSNSLGRYLTMNCGIPPEAVRDAVISASSVEEFLDRVHGLAKESETKRNIQGIAETSLDAASRDLNEMRSSVGLPELAPPRMRRSKTVPRSVAPPSRTKRRKR